MQLSDLVSHVIGVDTHKDAHTAAALDAATGGVLVSESARAARGGYEALVEMADMVSEPGDRAWAIEGTGSYGAGLADHLAARGEWVIEIDRPTRPARRDGAKSDDLDAVRAGREALSRTHWASPRSRGEREAMRVLTATRESAVRDRTRAINSLKAMIVSAPDELRDRLRGLDGAQLIDRCARLRDLPERDDEHRYTALALRRLARRIGHLEDEIADHHADVAELTGTHCPQLVAEFGVGPITAAWIYLAWSHSGRCRNEAAFASLAGVAPIEASSGQVVRHRLNRGGDRQLNRALHTVALTRTRQDPRTQDYIQARLAQGKSRREARRCLKRYIARHFFRLLEHPPQPT